MSDPRITEWKHSGKTYLWRYKDNIRNYPGWHFTADEESCRAFEELFGVMNDAIYSGSCEIPLSLPTERIVSVPNNRNGKARYSAAEKLRLKYDPSKINLWNMVFDGSTGLIEFGKEYLERLRKGIEDIRNGEGDYAIGPMDKDICFWIWWMI
jgi:hypothetical protein